MCECKCGKDIKELELDLDIEEGMVDPLSLATFSAERKFDPATRTIFLTGEINAETYTQVQLALSFLQLSPEPITIQLNSGGGSVFNAIGIVGLMRASPNSICVDAFGLVASAATLILAAGDIRRMSEFCWGMVHCAQYGAGGRHPEVKAAAAQGEREEKQWATWMEKFSKMPAKFWLGAGLNTDLWLTPSECKKYGIIDKVIKD